MNSCADISRLKKRHQFLAVARGRKWAAPGLVLQAAPAADASAMPEGVIAGRPGARTGFTVTKKVGNAVVRNRARRRLKEAARIVLPPLVRNGYDYVIVGRAATLTRAWPDLLDDLRLALTKIHSREEGKAPKRSSHSSRFSN